MRFRPLLFLPLLVLASCEKSPRDRLQGTWIGEGIAEVHPGQQAKADGWAKGTRLDFSGNKVTVSIPAETPRTGTFKIAKADGDEVDLLLKRPEGGDDRTSMTFAKDGKLLWSLGGGARVTMRKTVD